MKGISVWIWVIAGIIIGMVMFTLFVQIMSYVAMSRDKENVKETLGEFAATVNSFCDAQTGEKTTTSFSFSSSVDTVFSSKDGIGYEEGNRTFGKWLCAKMGKEVSCERLNCELEMLLIKQKPSFSSLTSTVFGPSYQDYEFEIAKTECGVSALEPGMKTDCKS